MGVAEVIRADTLLQPLPQGGGESARPSILEYQPSKKQSHGLPHDHAHAHDHAHDPDHHNHPYPHADHPLGPRTLKRD
jgi:hypothetical protein